MSSPNSSGQGLSDSTQATSEPGRRMASSSRRYRSSFSRSRLDDLRRRVLDEAVVGEHALAARDLLREAVDLGLGVAVRLAALGRTTASKMRALVASSFDARRCGGRSTAASCTRVERVASAPSSGSGHGGDDQPRLAAGRFVQISSVTCGITGCRSLSSRSRAATAVGARRRRLVEPRLDRLEVPVAEVVEGQAVEAVDAWAKSNSPRSPRPRAASARAREDPPLLERLRRARRSRCRPAPRISARRSRACSRASAPPRSRPRRSARPATTPSSSARSASRRRRTRRSASSGFMPVPRLFDIRRRSARARRVDDDVGERDVAHQLEPREDHPVLPEADDVARGRVQVARGRTRAAPVSRPASRASRTATAPTRTRCRARPGCG